MAEGGKKPGQAARGWPSDPGNFDWFKAGLLPRIGAGLNQSAAPYRKFFKEHSGGLPEAFCQLVGRAVKVGQSWRRNIR